MTTHLSLTIDEGGETELSLPTRSSSSSDERSRSRTRRQQKRRPPAVVVADEADVCSTSTTSVAATQKTTGERNKRDLQPTSSSTAPDHPARRLYLHRFGAFVSALSISAASGMGLVQLLGIFLGAPMSILQIVLRIYVFGFCIGIVLLETECKAILGDHPLLHQWTTRGLLTAFVGVVGLEEVETTELSAVELHGNTLAEAFYLRTLAGLLIAIGVVQLVLGISCIQEEYAVQRRVQMERKARSILGEAASTP